MVESLSLSWPLKKSDTATGVGRDSVASALRVPRVDLGSSLMSETVDDELLDDEELELDAIGNISVDVVELENRGNRLVDSREFFPKITKKKILFPHSTV